MARATAALALAAQGIRVLPLHHVVARGRERVCSCQGPDDPACRKDSPGKHPRLQHGVKEASADHETVARWWRRWPLANVAIATGLASGVDVLDVDGPEGLASLAGLEAKHGSLPFTPQASTGKGLHYFFAHDSRVWNRVALGPGLDVRTEGGYVVAPPSDHISGRAYLWALSLDDADLAPWPEWLIEELLKLRAVPTTNVTRIPVSPAIGQTTYTARAIATSLAEMESARVPSAGVSGNRNFTLNRTAYVLGQLVGAGEPIGNALEALKSIALAKGSPEAEVHSTATRAFDDGAKNPKAIRILAERAAREASSPKTRSRVKPEEAPTVAAPAEEVAGVAEGEIPPPTLPVGGEAPTYFVKRGGYAHYVKSKDGPVQEKLTNFTAKVVADVVEDDGVDTRRTFAIESKLGKRSFAFDVKAEDFHSLHWVTENMGPGAIVYTGSYRRDHARTAIQTVSGSPPERRVYTHMGWRKLGSDWVYLHGGGAVGASGPRSDVTVNLEGPLSPFTLPVPPVDPRPAIRSSLELLDVAPDRVTVPVFASIFRAVLGPSDLSLFLVGASGEGKSELAALAQQHWGPSLDARHLPGSWSSTGNALEGTAFLAKDALFVVDDFAPHGSASDVAKMHRDADRLIRAQGNGSGRGRMNADATLRAPRPPRGLIFGTGEDVPHGLSLRARMCVVEIEKGTLSWDRLSIAQANASAGLYAETLSAFLKWLAPRYESLRASLLVELAELRALVAREGDHRRTPAIVAQLLLGLRYFSLFACECLAITSGESDALWRRAVNALLSLSDSQRDHQQHSEPSTRFLSLLAASITAGRSHVATVDGEPPLPTPDRWGWRWVESPGREGPSGSWRPSGDRVGWLDGSTLLLDPESAFVVTKRFGGEGGDGIAISLPQLGRRLKERGILICDPRHTTKKRTVQDVRRRVFELDADVIWGGLTPKTTEEEPATRGSRGSRGSEWGTTNPEEESSYNEMPLMPHLNEKDRVDVRERDANPHVDARAMRDADVESASPSSPNEGHSGQRHLTMDDIMTSTARLGGARPTSKWGRPEEDPDYGDALEDPGKDQVR